MTTVFAAGTLSAGIPMRRRWTIDIHDDDQGRLRALFQARANGSDSDHRLFFANFDGSSWSWSEVCRLGGYLYSPENDYTGLAALAPNHADTIYVSTTIDPTTGATLGQYELYEGTTPDMGQTWTWSAITSNSSCDNLRPIAPSWNDERKAMLWLRGTYTSYTNYDMAVVGRIEAPELLFANADPWHLRTGFGNAGDVWTASENGAENAPMLRTQVVAQAVGPGCNGSQTLTVAPAPTLGSSVTTRMPSATPGSFAALQFGEGRLTPLDLGTVGAPGCWLYVGGSVSLSLGALAANGQSPSLQLPIPNNPALAAQRFALQGWRLDAIGALRTSPAVVLQPGL